MLEHALSRGSDKNTPATPSRAGGGSRPKGVSKIECAVQFFPLL